MFETKKVYKFSTLAPSILGGEFTMMKVITSETIASEVLQYGDMHGLNSKLVPLIPGLSSNANDNTYVVFETETGERVALAYEWIDDATIELIEGVNIRIDVSNASTADVTIIKNALKELGYLNLNIYPY